MPVELSNSDWPSVEDIAGSVMNRDHRVQELIDDKIPFVKIEIDDDPEKVEKYFIAPSTEWSSHYKSSYAVSNHRSLLKDFPSWLIDTGETGSEHAIAWPESRIRVMSSRAYEEIKDAFDGLNDYPIYDENDHSNLQSEMQDEAWNGFYRDEFRDELTKRSRVYAAEEEDSDGQPLIEKIEQYLESDETVDEIYYELIQNGNGDEWNEQSDGEWHLRIESILGRIKDKETGFDRAYDSILSHVLGRKFARYNDPRQMVLPLNAETIVGHLLSRPSLGSNISEQLSVAAKLMLASVMEGHDYSCVLIDLPKELSEQILGWSQQQIPEESLFVDKDGDKGRETELHVTVKYGLLDPMPTEALLKLFRQTTPFDISLRPISLFRQDDHDVVKLDISSAQLIELNRKVCEVVSCHDTYPTYTPHVTLAYVKKGTADRLEGTSPFENSTKFGVTTIGEDGVFQAKSVVFSSSVGDTKKEYTLKNL